MKSASTDLCKKVAQRKAKEKRLGKNEIQADVRHCAAGKVCRNEVGAEIISLNDSDFSYAGNVSLCLTIWDHPAK